MSQSHEALIARCRAGDAAAFEELAQVHQRRVFRIAYGLLANAEDAEDVTQDVLLTLYQTLRGGRLRHPQTLPAWLSQVCVNRCRAELRKRRREEAAAEWAFQANHEDGPDRRFASQETRIAIRQAILRLPRRQRAVFVLRHFAGLSIEEIARALQCRPATVRVHLSRATTRLREVLSEGGKGDA